MTSSVVIALLACLLCSSPAGGSPGAEDGDPQIVVMRDKGLEVQARQIRQMYPEVRKRVENALGWQLERPPTIVMVADREVFEKMSGNPLISAFAVPRQNSIVMLLPSASFDPYVLQETLEHELCHLLLHAHLRHELLPKWLDEGICQWLSGSLGEILAGQGFPATGSELMRHPIPLQHLRKSFPEEPKALLQAYEESRLFIDFLVAGQGKEGLLAVLERLKEGMDLDEAMLKTYSKSFEALQTEWLQELASRNLWLSWVSRYLYEIVFFSAALLTVLAFLRVLSRKRAYDRDEEGEE